MEVDPGQESVVIEHLLEVGDQPAVVDRVTGKPPAQVVVDPTRGHGVEGRGDHLEGRRVARRQEIAEQGLQTHGLGKLGCPTKAPPYRVVLGGKLEGRRVEGPLGWRSVVGRNVGLASYSGRQAATSVVEVGTSVGPGLTDRDENLGEGRHAAPRAVRPVGATMKGTSVGVAEHGHRPAAPTGQRGDSGHVDTVHVGPFFPVHLHVHESVVHQGGGIRVLERFVGHDVAPMAGGVADRQEHRHVPSTRLDESLVTPWKPLDRIGGVLAQTRAALIGQAIHPGDPT